MKVKTIDLKGKEYAQVKDRIKAFREATTNGAIETSVTLDGGNALIKATVIHDLSDEHSKRATGTAYGTIKSGDKSFEKLETIAVGRALAYMGYLADGAIASSEEMEEFEEYKGNKIDEAVVRLEECSDLDELKRIFTALGGLMGEPKIVEAKERMKKQLTK
jgi:hypothetical protein